MAGSTAQPLANLHECIDIARSSNWYGHPTILYAFSLAARFHADEGEVLEARSLLRQAVAVSDDVGDRPALMMAVERAVALLGGFVTAPVSRARSILPRRERSERWHTMEVLKERLGQRPL